MDQGLKGCFRVRLLPMKREGREGRGERARGGNPIEDQIVGSWGEHEFRSYGLSLQRVLVTMEGCFSWPTCCLKQAAELGLPFCTFWPSSTNERVIREAMEWEILLRL